MHQLDLRETTKYSLRRQASKKKCRKEKGGGTVSLLIFQAKWGCGRKKPEIGGTYVRRQGKVTVGRVSVLLFPPRERERRPRAQHSLRPPHYTFLAARESFFFEIVRKGKGRGAALKKNRREE